MAKEQKVNSLTVTELKELISEALNSCFSERKSSDSEIIGIDEVCEITGLSKYTIYKKTSNKEMPFYKSTMGKRSVLRFRRSEIEKWVLKYRIETVDEFLEILDGL